MREDVEQFLEKKVKITCQIEDRSENVALNYTGLVLEINEESLHLRDKFDKLVVLSLDSIKNIVEV